LLQRYAPAAACQQQVVWPAEPSAGPAVPAHITLWLLILEQVEKELEESPSIIT
jgi:hypothetical protein